MRLLCTLTKVQLAIAAILMAVALDARAESRFPFESEMLLDVRPLPGSKRVPILEILSNGRATIDLWCSSGEGQAEVAGEAIRFVIGALQEQSCTPERQQRDQDLAAALSQVTQWRLEDDVLVLIGPTELRYRLSTH
jgi:heat shock protein HslJ